MKRILSFLLIAAMVIALVSCGGPTPSETTETEKTSETTTGKEPTQTTSTSSTEETTTQTEETTASQGTEDELDSDIPDGEVVSVGDYVTVIYNAAACDLDYKVERGLGSRQNVTLTATMKDDFVFNGWSAGNVLPNLKGAAPDSESLTYTFEATSDQTIYLNTSMQLIYHANGGEQKSGWNGTDLYNITLSRNPNTLPDQDWFSREGYTLVAYNTQEDGSGEEISLGSKVSADNKGKIDLYCVWEKDTDEANFVFTKSGQNATITGYTGTDKTVVIPQTLDGATVVKIADAAFTKSDVQKVVIAKTVKLVEKYAFDRCESLETVVLSDASLESGGLSEESFFGCDALKNIRINSAYTLTDAWQSFGATKLDRLIWAKDQKKLIIIGGSGSYYGFNCAMLEEALGGEYEIINYGENANITALSYFDIVEDYIKEGDIILWAPEPGASTLGTDSVGSRFWGFKKSNYDFMKNMDISLYRDLLSSFSSYCAELRSSSTKFKAYDALDRNTNKYGDNISPRNWNGKVNNYSFRYSISAKDAMSDLFTKITEKGASIYFTFAAMQETGIEKVKEGDILNFQKQITSLPGVVVISDYKNCVFADDLFFDSAWHMTDEGAAERTEHVIADLLAQLETQK